MNNNIYKDIKFLDKKYKKMVDIYFKNKTGKFIIKNNILKIDFENWGIENFFILKKNIKFKKKFYEILYEKFNEIYSLAISFQIANWNVFMEMLPYLNNFKNINYNIYFTLIDELCSNEHIEFLKENFENVSIIQVRNRGMDIGLFLINLHYIKSKNYKHDFLYKIHTKSDGYLRGCILTNLMGSYQRIINNLKVLSMPHIGMIAGSWVLNYCAHQPSFTANEYYLRLLIKNLYHTEMELHCLQFVVATFFAIKMEAFKILNLNTLEFLYEKLNDCNTIDFSWYSFTYNMDLNCKEKMIENFKNDKSHRFLNVLDHDVRTNRNPNALRDRMIEHSIERIFGYIIKKNNLEIVHI